MMCRDKVQFGTLRGAVEQALKDWRDGRPTVPYQCSRYCGGFHTTSFTRGITFEQLLEVAKAAGAREVA